MADIKKLLESFDRIGEGAAKVKAPAPRNVVAKNAKTSGAGQHKNPREIENTRKEKHKKDFLKDLHEAEKDTRTLRRIEEAYSKFKEAKMHISPSGVKTNMSRKDDDYEINYGKNGLVAKHRKKLGLDVKTGEKKDVTEGSLNEGVMDQLKRIYIMLVNDLPMGTPESEFLGHWQRIIYKDLGKKIDIDTLAKLRDNFVSSYKTMGRRGDALDWHREMGQDLEEGLDDTNAIAQELDNMLNQGSDYVKAVKLIAKKYNTHPEYVVRAYEEWGGFEHDDTFDIKEQGVAEGWKGKVAGAALGAAALGGIGKVIHDNPNVTIDDVTYAKAITMPNRELAKDLKVQTDEHGNKIYTFYYKAKHGYRAYYYPVEKDIKESKEDLSKYSTEQLRAYVERVLGGGVPAFGSGAKLKRVQAELKRREQGMAEGFERFQVGDKISFPLSQMATGVVDKIDDKRLYVKLDNGEVYTIPSTMLHSVKLLERQGVAEGEKISTPPGSYAWKLGYQRGMKDTTNNKPVGSPAYKDGWRAAKKQKQQGVAEAGTIPTSPTTPTSATSATTASATQQKPLNLQAVQQQLKVPGNPAPGSTSTSTSTGSTNPQDLAVQTVIQKAMSGKPLDSAENNLYHSLLQKANK